MTNGPTSDLRDRPIGELLSSLAQETSTLVRQELELAKAELTLKGRKAGVGIGELGGAGIVALFALGALTTCFIAALALAMPVWGAALIVGVVYAGVAGILALNGRRRLAEAIPPTPDQTIETVKEDVQWAKTRMSSGSK